ncbi:MAG: polysaccharide pyruvyl transferase family protein [Hyphomonadaceae bacterium]
MQYVYAGNFTAIPNWGCRSTGLALESILAEKHRVSDSIAVESLLHTGWDQFARPFFRQGGLLPYKWSSAAWAARRVVPRAYRKFQTIDRLLGARYDFVSADPHESVTRFHAARKHHPRLEEIYQSIVRSDAVVINGEGTMIFSNPARRDVLFTNFLMALALQSRKKLFLLNAMFDECPQTGLDRATLATSIELLNEADGVACRERASYEFLIRHGCKSRLSTIPDALFSWTRKVRSAAEHIELFERDMLPFGTDGSDHVFDFTSSYICVAGSSSVHRMGERRAIEAYVGMVEALKEICPNVILVRTCHWDHYLETVGKATASPVVPQEIPVLMGAAILARARLFVSGRYHPSILASLSGTPCVFLAANSHKTTTLQQTLGYTDVKTFSEVPDQAEIKKIASFASDRFRNSDKLRNVLASAADLRAAQAQRFLDFVDGGEVGLLL